MTDNNTDIYCTICLRKERIERIMTIIQRRLTYLASQTFTKTDLLKFRRANYKVAKANAQLTRDTSKSKVKAKLKTYIDAEIKMLWRKHVREIMSATPTSKRYARLKTHINIMIRSHPKCKGCGILFGRYHLESPTATPMGELCGNCLKHYNTKGAGYYKQPFAI